jgi:hypothetical protein
MNDHHRRPEREVVFRDIRELTQGAERENGPWPSLPEPKFSGYEKAPSLAERVVLWTMAGVIGALTIYAIATGDRQVLIAILGVASGVLVRYTKGSPRRVTEEENDNEDSS